MGASSRSASSSESLTSSFLTGSFLGEGCAGSLGSEELFGSGISLTASGSTFSFLGVSNSLDFSILGDDGSSNGTNFLRVQ